MLIGTRNRPALLARCLRSVVAQAYPDLEVVVLDDASEPGVDPAPLQRMAGAIPLHFLRADVQQGLNAVRNQLLAKATGDLFFIIDDDAFFDAPDALQQVVNAFQRNKALGLVATKILDSRSGTVRPLTPHSRRHIRRDASVLDDAHLISYFLGGAHALHRRVVDTCGNYDEVLMYGLDEIELAYRALEAGFQIEYHPDIIVHHQPPPAPAGKKKESAWRLYYLTRNRILFAYKHLPARYACTYVPGWLAWYGYRALASGLLPEFFRGLGDGLKTMGQLQRRPISARTIAYLKANYGRLWR